ncbi:MAG: flagellar type III secretion system pore protein FliP [Syntrophobacterales bacterium]|nr:flagellar type III secretion system pore protein FliP [Syntrophobacterales bacterium]
MKRLICITAISILILSFSSIFSGVLAEELRIPPFIIDLKSSKGPEQLSTVMRIALVITVISVAPAILLLMTSFTRIVVVFSFLRHALGTQQAPPNQVLVSLALFLTFFIMKPVWNQAYENAYIPYREGEISDEEFLDNFVKPFKDFMLKNTRKKDLALFASLATGGQKPGSPEELPLTTIIPAFAISEMKTAFEIGFLIYVPFLILDMVVASILLSMGMMMLPPVMISLPFKIMLFILVDGWGLLIESLIKSFS